MALTGKLETEVEFQSPATKVFNVFVTQIHDIPNISDVVHDGKLHQGDDWHGVGSDSVKQWTFVADGKVQTCKEHFEEIDHVNKTLTANFFDGDIGKLYKKLKVKLRVTEKGNGNNGGVAHWTFEYEKLHEGIPPPQPYFDNMIQITKDIDTHFTKTTT